MTVSINKDEIQAVIDSNHGDIFSCLGLQVESGGTFSVRVFIPGATAVCVCSAETKNELASLECLHDDGFFAGTVPFSEPSAYLLKVRFGDSEVVVHDCYRFSSQIEESDLYLYGEGTNEKSYDFLGAHLIEVDGVTGCRFSVWAPNASRVSVVGDFNSWDGRCHMMRKLVPSGVWEIFVPEVDEGALYKYELKNADGHLLPHKADPYGYYAQKPPEQASIVARHDTYDWNDSSWIKRREQSAELDSPISIYEVHLGSWKRVVDDGNRSLSYRELAADLIPYVKNMGFTHIQLMPISEFPFDGSWGYQPVGLYAATSRYGEINDLKYFIDQCHQQGISVLVDWVPGHFPTDAHGLGRFDGTALYEHADARQGYHPDWNTYIYNYSRNEISNFLMSSALFWLDKFHVDGLRVDAVASMLYLDYSRNEGEWIANRFGGRENLDAIDFIKDTNERAYKNFPGTMMVAEESTAWPGVSKPTFAGGLGYGYKWNMGWMNDSLSYMSKEPVHRVYHHHNMTFSLLYAFSENFILPLSHDEVVHGKGSILDRMPGDAWQQFANLRAYYAFMWAHPGKKLLFMGCEFGQGPEWDHDSSLCWHQLEVSEHAGVQTLIRDLNACYQSEAALHSSDSLPDGFEWVEADDRHNSIFAFVRKSKDSAEQVLVVCNMTPVLREAYRVGVNTPGVYKEILNTDSEIYAGSNKGNGGSVSTTETHWHGRNHSIEIVVPPLATLIFKLQ